MKTLALTLAATLIASTSAFAGSALFDVNEAPINYGSENAQVLDVEYTASIDGAAADYNPNINTALFDVTDQ
jgi:hypothetical protein